MKTWQMSPMPSRDRGNHKTQVALQRLRILSSQSNKSLTLHCICSINVFLPLTFCVSPAGLFSSKAVREECIFFKESRWDFWTCYGLVL